jgi:hypothetical protein
MDLYVLNANDGDLDYIQDRGFPAKRKKVYSEERVNKVIFCTCQSEKQDHGDILASKQVNMSSPIYGRADIYLLS